MTELENSIKVLTEHTQHYVPTEDLEHLYAVIEAAGKLAEYETAEEDGRLYILPHGVNVGDCVHAICRFMRDKASTIGINRIMCSEIPMIGRIVSPSHEEIKKVLEKMPKSDSNSESQQLEIKVCRYEKEKT